MSRDVNDDFEELFRFVGDYTLSSSALHDSFRRLLSSQHKRYFAVLTVLAELKHQGILPVKKTVSAHEAMNAAFYNYLAESVSDLGISLFVWTHGAYKASRQLLRSSIESYFKGIGSIESEKIIQLKNVYEVIDIAGNISFFQETENKPMYDQLVSFYDLLCKDVHTATIQNMEHVSALGYFPNFDEQAASAFEKLFLRISQLYLSVVCLLFRETYLKMHYKNLDIVASVLPSDVKKRIHG